MDLLLQCGVISLVTTAFEAIVGNIDYYFLHLNMWDYATLPLHALNGKISLQFSILWFLLGFVIDIFLFPTSTLCKYFDDIPDTSAISDIVFI